MDINKYQGENYGSLILIEFLPVQYISSFAPSAAGTISSDNIVITAGFTWSKIYCTEDTMSHQQTQSIDDNGESWQQTVKGFTPADQQAIENGFLSMSRNRYLVRITRPDGLMKIVGTPDDPLDYKLDSNTNPTMPGPAGTTTTFAGITADRALIYTP